MLGTGFLKHGYEVCLGTRDPRKLEIQHWLQENPARSVGTFERAAEEAVSLSGLHNLAGKTVMDTTNPIAEAPPVGGILPFFTGPNESVGERIQSALPQAHVVKAFNSVGAPQMVNPTYRRLARPLTAVHSLAPARFPAQPVEPCV